MRPTTCSIPLPPPQDGPFSTHCSARGHGSCDGADQASSMHKERFGTSIELYSKKRLQPASAGAQHEISVVMRNLSQSGSELQPSSAYCWAVIHELCSVGIGLQVIHSTAGASHLLQAAQTHSCQPWWYLGHTYTQSSSSAPLSKSPEQNIISQRTSPLLTLKFAFYSHAISTPTY